MFGRIEHGTRWVASRDDLSSIVSRSLERSAQGQALPSTPPSACYPKTDDKDVNGCARKAPRDYRADHVPGGELLSNDGRHLDLYRGCKVVLSVREWRPRAAGGSFYSAKNNSQKQQPVSCNRISLVVSGVGQSETRKSLIQECWFSAIDGASGRQPAWSMGPTMMTHVGDKTAFRRAFSQLLSRVMASAMLRLGVVASARRTVNLTSRLDRGSSLATPAFQAVHSRKSVRAFASESC